MEKSPSYPRSVLSATLLAASISLALLLTGCTSGGSQGQTGAAPQRTATGFSATLLPGSDLGGGDAGRLSLEAVTAADGTVEVSLSLSGARDLRACYAALDYDAARFYLLSAEPAAGQAEADRLIHIVDSTRFGRVEYGQVLANPLARSGQSGSFALATMKFAPGRSNADRSPSDAPVSPLSAVELSFDSLSQLAEWRYSMQGDYDQNGLVTVADLTPLGIHLNTEVTDPLSAKAQADGDANGLVTLADLTPIGANFGRSLLGGFKVYRSDNAADYPDTPTGENGPGTELVGTVEIADALNAGQIAQQRLRFSFDAAASSGLYMWLRPSDGSELGIASNLVTTTASDPPLLVDPLLGAGDYNSLAIVEGFPAIAYQRGATRELYYTRAQDSAGEAWSLPVLVDGSGISNGLDPCLAVVNGRPAISYYFADTSKLRYVRASNSTGSAWGTFILVDPENNSGQWSSLALVDGKPAISYYNTSSFSLSYVRALDDDGAAWGTIETVDATPFNGGYSSLRVVNGRPAIAYHQFPFGDDELGLLRYARANDAQGASWPASGITVDEQAQFQGLYPQLLVVEGQPAILHFDQSGGDLRYVRASDSDGSAWPAGIVAAAGSAPSERFQAALIDGRPAAAFGDSNEQELRFIISQDGLGASWLPARVLDSNQGAGFNPALLQLPGGEAGVAYGRVDTGLQFLGFTP